MPRRSKRLKEKMSDHEKDDDTSSQGENDEDKTMIQAKDPSIAHLELEIQTMKTAMMEFMENFKKLALPATNADDQMPVGTSSRSESSILPTITSATATHHAAATTSICTVSNKLEEPPQALNTTSYIATAQPPTATTCAYSAPTSMQYRQNTCEYTMPYNIPFTAAQAYVPPTTHLPSLPPQLTALPQAQPPLFYPSATPRMTSAVRAAHQPYSTYAAQQLPMQQTFNNQLRKLHDLPEFAGHPEQWPMFINLYMETTRNYQYTNLENLMRLQKSVKGDAKCKVESILIHPDSVAEVISTLEFHYGRPQVLIRSQIAKVRAFPSIAGKRMHEIINFSTMVSNLTKFLENANATAHLNNPTLLEELINKLPTHKREEWMKHSTINLGPYPSVREFSLWLQEIAKYVSLVVEIENHKDVACHEKDKTNPSFTITKEGGRLTNCLMCRENHPLYGCNKFKEASTSDRWKFVKQNNLCFGCLRAGHSSARCQTKRQCGLSKCVKYHNKMLHEDFNTKNKINDDKNKSNVVKINNVKDSDDNISIIRESDDSPVITIVDESISAGTLFKFLPVQLKGPKGTIEIVAFIDEGSKITLLENDIARKIGLKGNQSNLRLGWIGGKTTNEMSEKVNTEISPKGKHGYGFQMRNVWTTSNLKLPPQCLHLEKFVKRFPVLNGIEIDNYDARPKMLIGLPHIRLVRPSNVINLDDCFAVHETNLGNILFGSNEDHTEATVCRIDCEILENIQRQINEYFALGNLGVKCIEPIVSADDKRSEEILKDTTKKTGNRYETGLLWRFDDYSFKDTYPMAMKRLRNVEAKMRNDDNLADWYKAKIDDYISKSYVRKLTQEECQFSEDRTWYLPHFVITNQNKDNKRRLVFDAAACVGGESFNSRLMKGPEKYQPRSLLSILFKFRQRKFGVCADIREMFHRVEIRKEDQTAQRFLWRCDTTRPPDEYVMQVMIFGSVSSPCSAQYVKNMNAEVYRDIHPQAYRAIVDCHYVDDYVDSFDEEDEAIKVTKEVVTIQQKAGFELRGFVSNSRNLLNAIDGNALPEKDFGLRNLCKDENTTEKILGMFWSPSEDAFCFVLKFARVPEAVLKGDRKPTKSEVLSLTMSIFDPFGFLANMVIKSKILLQELWRYKIDWNSQIPEQIYEKWYEWYQSLQNVQFVKIPRCYGLNFDNEVGLHIFVDASEVAYAAVAYWRISAGDGVNIQFIAGKSRCAPIKPLSIPRLELQASVLGVRLKGTIISSHDIKPSSVTFWSDSKTVIKWIRSDSRAYKQFVCHRVSELLESSEVEQWRWVPGSQNPADDATRPRNFSDTSINSHWLKGPNFLKSAAVNWPKLPEDIEDYDCKTEKRAKFILTMNVDNIIPFEKYSSFNKLVRVMCWVRRAVELFKSYVPHRTESAPLSVKEMNESTYFLCRVAQHDTFLEEYNDLKMSKPISKSSSIYKLTPSLDHDDLIRLSGRINNANCVGTDTKRPIILPRDHILTRLIVKQYHEDFKHQNQESICAAIRLKYWIPSIRQVVRSVKKSCQICKNRAAVPKPPLMGQLPIDRLTPYVRPFAYTGVDYLGPFLVSVGRRSEKRWVALFTCLTIRAVHLEISKDLSTDGVILCIRNFVNRRGLPVRMRSDRGTNFIGAAKEDLGFEEAKVAEECTKRGVEWVFNAPANPSAGGAWERMVRSVKNVLAFTLKEKSPQVETLQSLLIEAENLINSRPLTHLPIESSDDDPLTPNHFLIGCPNTLQTPAVPEKVCLRKQWQILQQLKQTFWKRWVMEYLPELTRRTKWYQPVKPIAVGDVVLICDDNEARGEWKKGMIEDVFPAADGQVRSAVIRTSIGRLRRPASKLAVLDVGGESSGSTHGWRDVVK